MNRVWSWLTGRSAAPAPVPAAHDPAATATDEAMMRRALELASHAAALGEVPVGAVVYRTRTGEALATGYNRRECDRDPAAHAEFLAMREAARVLGDWRLEGCTVVVTLEPCPMCAGMIVNARPDRVVYGAADPKAGAVRSLFRVADDPRLNHRAEIITGVLAEECSNALREFFRGLRSRKRGGTASGGSGGSGGGGGGGGSDAGTS